jgi:hypothetical protein
MKRTNQIVERFVMMFGVSIACYLPALGLIGVNYFIAKPNVEKSQPTDSTGKTVEVKDLVANEVAKVKSDLFGQISFPVIFSIVSIFAAFAVKDIVSEFLKKDEKKDIVEEIKSMIETTIIPRIMKEHKDNVFSNLKELEAYIAYLEYEMLRNSLKQILDGISQAGPLSNAWNDQIIASINQISERKNYKMLQVSPYFGDLKLQEMLHADIQYMKAAVKTIKSNNKIKEALVIEIDGLSKNVSSQKALIRFIPENISSRSSDLFQTQLNLLITTLMGSPENNEELVKEILDLISIPNREAIEREQRSQSDGVPRPQRPK